MRKLFCRIGSKTNIADLIIGLFPKNYTEYLYIEPFAGGAGVYWVKKPSVAEILNDKDKALIQAYKNVQNVVVPDDYKKYGSIKSTEQLTAFMRSPPKNSFEKFLKDITKYCYTFSSKGVGKAYERQNGSIIGKVPLIPKYQERMKNTKFLSQDYKTIIKKYDSPHTLFYLDPPYEESKGIYKNHSIDYVEMVKLLKNIKGIFVLSLNYNKDFLELFKDFNIYKIHVKSQSRGNSDIGHDRYELLIKNYA
jgi:DNA adenine methylase